MSLKIKAFNSEYFLSEYVLYSIAVGIGNVLFSDSFILGSLFSYGQIVYLLFLFFCEKKKSKAVCEMFISTALAQEYKLAGTSLCYSVKAIRFLGVNLIFWVLFFFVVEALLNRRLWDSLISTGGSSITKLVRLICLINVLGLFLGFFNVFVFNDNSINTIPGYAVTFFELIYSYIGLTVFPIIVLYWRFIFDSDLIVKIKNSIQGVFLALILSIFISLLLGKYSYDWGAITLKLSPVGMYLPFLLLYPFYKETKHKYLWLFLGALGLVLGIYFFPGGKGMLSLIPLGIIILILLFKNYNKSIRPIIIGCVAPVSVITLFYMIIKRKLSNAIISKFLYALYLIDITNPNWWNIIPPSPKWRLVELINIWTEFINKPWFILLGKGYMGTTHDYTGYLGLFSGDLSGAEAGEWATGLFYSMHESINRMFLCNGILGLAILCWIIYKMIKRFDVSPYIFIGGFWLVFFWGYSFQMAALGIMALFAGFIDISYFEKNRAMHRRSIITPIVGKEE